MRFIHDNLYPLFAAMLIIMATTCWFGTSEPAQPKTLTPAVEPWSLPKQAEHDSNKSIDVINAHNLWGTVTANAPKPPEWHLLGIALSGTDRFILLSYDGKPAEIHKVGDTLLDGTKIVQIENNRLFVMTPDNKKLTFGINKHDQAK